MQSLLCRSTCRTKVQDKTNHYVRQSNRSFVYTNSFASLFADHDTDQVQLPIHFADQKQRVGLSPMTVNPQLVQELASRNHGMPREHLLQRNICW